MKYLKIEPLKKSDLNQASRFMKGVLKKLSFYSPEALKFNLTYSSPKYLNNLLLEKDVRFYVAKEKGIVGLAYGFEMAKGSFYICWVMVSDKARRSSIGSDLLTAVIDSSSATNKEIVADVVVGNIPSAKFFLANGFKKVGVVKHWDQKYNRYIRKRKWNK